MTSHRISAPSRSFALLPGTARPTPCRSRHICLFTQVQQHQSSPPRPKTVEVTQLLLSPSHPPPIHPPPSDITDLVFSLGNFPNSSVTDELTDCKTLLLDLCQMGGLDFLRRRQWHPTPVLLPGKSHGWRGLVGCSHGVAKSQT